MVPPHFPSRVRITLGESEWGTEPSRSLSTTSGLSSPGTSRPYVCVRLWGRTGFPDLHSQGPQCHGDPLPSPGPTPTEVRPPTPIPSLSKGATTRPSGPRLSLPPPCPLVESRAPRGTRGGAVGDNGNFEVRKGEDKKGNRGRGGDGPRPSLRTQGGETGGGRRELERKGYSWGVPKALGNRKSGRGKGRGRGRTGGRVNGQKRERGGVERGSGQSGVKRRETRDRQRRERCYRDREEEEWSGQGGWSGTDPSLLFVGRPSGRLGKGESCK